MKHGSDWASIGAMLAICSMQCVCVCVKAAYEAWLRLGVHWCNAWPQCVVSQGPISTDERDMQLGFVQPHHGLSCTSLYVISFRREMPPVCTSVN